MKTLHLLPNILPRTSSMQHQDLVRISMSDREERPITTLHMGEVAFMDEIISDRHPPQSQAMPWRRGMSGVKISAYSSHISILCTNFTKTLSQ